MRSAARRRKEREPAAAEPESERRLSGELALACGRQEPEPERRVRAVARAPPDEDSGHGSTAAASDEQLGKLAAGVQVSKARPDWPCFAPRHNPAF